MKKILVELEEEHYKQLNDLINWINMENKFSHKDMQHNIEDFAKGAVISKLKEMDNLIQNLFSDNYLPAMKNNFKKIAKTKNIKQADISRIANINKSTLSLVFNNELQPRTENFFKIWVLLGCPPIGYCIYFED